MSEAYPCDYCGAEETVEEYHEVFIGRCPPCYAAQKRHDTRMGEGETPTSGQVIRQLKQTIANQAIIIARIDEDVTGNLLGQRFVNSRVVVLLKADIAELKEALQNIHKAIETHGHQDPHGQLHAQHVAQVQSAVAKVLKEVP